jgi:hypothetical protein
MRVSGSLWSIVLSDMDFGEVLIPARADIIVPRVLRGVKVVLGGCRSVVVPELWLEFWWASGSS